MEINEGECLGLQRDGKVPYRTNYVNCKCKVIS